MKLLPRISLVEFFTALALLIVLTAFTLSITHGVPRRPSPAQIAKKDAARIVRAVLRYESDYGHPLVWTTNTVSGDLVTALTGSNTNLNPRNIPYLTLTDAGGGRSGLKKGRYVDPWGRAYRIAIAPAGHRYVLAGTNHIPIPKVGVWTLPPADLVATNPSAAQRRYITSW